MNASNGSGGGEKMVEAWAYAAGGREAAVRCVVETGGAAMRAMVGSEAVVVVPYTAIVLHAASTDDVAERYVVIQVDDAADGVMVPDGWSSGDIRLAPVDASDVAVVVAGLTQGIRDNPVEVDEEAMASMMAMMSMMAGMQAGPMEAGGNDGGDEGDANDDDGGVVAVASLPSGLIRSEEEMEAALADNPEARARYERLCSVLVVEDSGAEDDEETGDGE
ncbi:uncharacterized protein AMSG_05288 [Thecamonas trahens ATCC 50062]|uniref:Uncharacterized protein n=1 Tax=Thecamonas trahens ATCC 50062 TaxID=461836 RepID=A0A0L0DB19_THETB|nr:hypothetical protein AMSG_05288 [Thecamonas trahens ATCC 50062]KNC49291.1 hypothetical protein AMSG_05288 [Thecamonas trahens ATCC 50062]|eukprot:XP_013758004.1 hypothetical protein AMSG_05288 [Thecamonas trahens ATCC 50062]